MALSSTGSDQQSNRYGLVKFCRCGLRAPEWTSFTRKHPGMRFNGCPNYKEPEKDCGYFEWVDQFPKRAIDVINEARDEANDLQLEISKMEVLLSKRKQRNSTLKQEIKRLELELRSQVNESRRLKSQNEKYEWKEKMYLGLVVMLRILNELVVYLMTNDKKRQFILP